MIALIMVWCLMPFFIFPILSLASSCPSFQCGSFYICEPFSLDSNISCHGAPAYPLICKNDTLWMNQHPVTHIDYQHKQIILADRDCENETIIWKDFLAQIPAANASEYSCNDNTLVIQWTQSTEPICTTYKLQEKMAILLGVSLGGAAIGVFVGAAAVIILGILYLCLCKRKGQKAEKQVYPVQIPPTFPLNIIWQKFFPNSKEAPRMFSYTELVEATNCFSPELKLGSGGFGTVYKGILDNGTVVAIKKSKDIGDNSTESFVNEVTILSQVNHKNLVKLHGCCVEKDKQLLVYEYVPNGTLYDHLHGRFKGQGLSWKVRVQIAVETAEALAYLHCAASPPIYHRDVKSSNILLNNAMGAKVSDFGMSRLVPADATHVSTLARGTPGYIDPKYYETYKVTDKSDVYSFGVVLLEMITGEKAIDLSRSDVSLSAYSISYIKRGLLKKIVDPNLEAIKDLALLHNVRMVADLALRCLALSTEDRPTMKQVLEELLKIKEQCVTAKNNFVIDMQPAWQPGSTKGPNS